MASATDTMSRTTDRARGIENRGEPTVDQIAKRAYELWLRKGKPNGHRFQNWLEAEAELRKPIEW